MKSFPNVSRIYVVHVAVNCFVSFKLIQFGAVAEFSLCSPWQRTSNLGFHRLGQTNAETVIRTFVAGTPTSVPLHMFYDFDEYTFVRFGLAASLDPEARNCTGI